MAYGITTSRAHLTATNPLWPEAGEIDWDKLTAWLSPTDLPPPPTFAGRYFLGWATQAELDAGSGFCLWGHGEARGHGEGQVHVLARLNGDGSAQPEPLRIVPLQRAYPDRQQATGDEGLWFGYQDATALAQYVNHCLAVGDLDIVDTKQILSFLEVADGTAPSVDYWASWATALHEAVLFPKGADRDWLQALMPAILCAFPYDRDAGKFLPESGVRACLDKSGSPGFRTQCHGLWARRLAGDPELATHSFEWANIGDYRQPQRIAGLELPYMRRVPVRYLRSFEGPDGWDISDEATRETLSLVTIDQPAAGGDEDPLGATLRATDWAADRADENGLLSEVPTQFGIDTGARITDPAAACLATKDVVVTSLSYHSRGTPVGLRGPCRMALRYYRPSGNRLTLAESQALSRNGIQVVATWQHTAILTQGWERYVHDLVRPFVNREGRTDGETAFTYAAETIGQTPYTPILFSIDFPVGHPGYTDNRPGSVAVATPDLDTILDYFRDVGRGYRDYLATHPDRPYYIGVYAYSDTCADLYRAGLVSHCWQPPWWGTPFAHLNVWQIGMFSHEDMARDNAILQTCRPATSKPNQFWVDIDVAWGDPGSFQVFP